MDLSCLPPDQRLSELSKKFLYVVSHFDHLPKLPYKKTKMPAPTKLTQKVRPKKNLGYREKNVKRLLITLSCQGCGKEVIRNAKQKDKHKPFYCKTRCKSL